MSANSAINRWRLFNILIATAVWLAVLNIATVAIKMPETALAAVHGAFYGGLGGFALGLYFGKRQAKRRETHGGEKLRKM